MFGPVGTMRVIRGTQVRHFNCLSAATTACSFTNHQAMGYKTRRFLKESLKPPPTSGDCILFACLDSSSSSVFWTTGSMVPFDFQNTFKSTSPFRNIPPSFVTRRLRSLSWSGHAYIGLEPAIGLYPFLQGVKGNVSPSPNFNAAACIALP
jgi:hypothetical protein